MILYTAPSDYFIWSLMDAEAVKKFYDKDPENHGLILDETNTLLSDFIIGQKKEKEKVCDDRS